MDLETVIYIKLTIVILCAALIYWRMMVIQRRKEQRALEQFELLMKTLEAKSKREKKQNVPENDSN